MKHTATPQRPSWRPTLIGKRYAIACGHYLAAAAAARILERNSFSPRGVRHCMVRPVK